jgi:hypothetical protein
MASWNSVFIEKRSGFQTGILIIQASRKTQLTGQEVFITEGTHRAPCH